MMDDDYPYGRGGDLWWEFGGEGLWEKVGGGNLEAVPALAAYLQDLGMDHETIVYALCEALATGGRVPSRRVNRPQQSNEERRDGGRH
jgi:hypothetical protein